MTEATILSPAEVEQLLSTHLLSDRECECGDCVDRRNLLATFRAVEAERDACGVQYNRALDGWHKAEVEKATAEAERDAAIRDYQELEVEAARLRDSVKRYEDAYERWKKQLAEYEVGYHEARIQARETRESLARSFQTEDALRAENARMRAVVEAARTAKRTRGSVEWQFGTTECVARATVPHAVMDRLAATLSALDAGSGIDRQEGGDDTAWERAEKGTDV